MKTLKELREMLGKFMTEKEELEEKRDTAENKAFSEAQEKRYVEILDEMEKLIPEIEEAQRQEEIGKRALSLDTRTKKSEGDAKKDGGLEIRNAEEEKIYRNLGEQLIDVALAERTGNVPKRLSTHQTRALKKFEEEARATGMSEAIPSDGGFLVQTDFSTELFKKAHDTGLLMPRTRTIPIGPNANGLKMNTIDETSRANGSRWGGIRAYWFNEGGTKTPTHPKFGRIELNLEKLIGLVYSTDELLMDAAALGAVVNMGFGEEFGFKVDDALVNGTGAGQPLGMLNSGALITVDAETGQAAATIVFENILKMWARAWSKSKPNMVWLINSEVMPQLMTMVMNVGTGGVPVYMPPGGVSGNAYGTLFGRPVLEIEQAAALGTVGDIMLADLSQYLTIEKGGIQSASSIHVQFVTDETAFRFVMRVNGQPMWDSPLTKYKGSDTVGPFVALATRS